MEKFAFNKSLFLINCVFAKTKINNAKKKSLIPYLKTYAKYFE